jgi:transcriptional regulator with XRE-family HTH domain
MNRGARKLFQAGGTQQDKAEKLGVTQQTISRWLGHGVVPNGEQLIRVQQAYGIPIDDWLEEEETPPDTERADH